jgi:hypothetical protein
MHVEHVNSVRILTYSISYDFSRLEYASMHSPDCTVLELKQSLSLKRPHRQKGNAYSVGNTRRLKFSSAILILNLRDYVLN